MKLMLCALVALFALPSAADDDAFSMTLIERLRVIKAMSDQAEKIDTLERELRTFRIKTGCV